jgi:hypothetical protein
LIDKITNIRIGKRAPSDYLAQIRDAWGGDDALRDLLDSHLLPSGGDSPLMHDDFDAFLNWREQRLAREIEAVTGVSVDRGPTAIPEDAVADLADAGTVIDASAVLPGPVAGLIENRASSWIRPLAERFAVEAISFEGVELRAQQSKGDPSYFQVRHPGFGQVVAYVHPRQAELHIEYRLPADHERYSAAQRRDNVYGIVMKVRQSADLPIAVRLLRDALAKEA